MRDRRTLRPSLVALALLGVLGIVGPWLAPHPPHGQIDPVSTRYRPPLTRLLEVRLEEGGMLLADRAERRGDDLVVERRGERQRIPGARLAPGVAAAADDGELPGRLFLLGTDKFGRDLLSRLLHGARLTLLVAGAAAGIAFVLGTLVGVVAGLAGRFTDAILMRIVDGLLAIPWLFLLIAIAAVVPTGPTTLTLILGGTAWTAIARIARAQTLALRDEPWMLAARELGASPARRVLRHLLPNALPPILVEGALVVGALVTAEASLSFLGLGIPPPHPSWGAMIAEARHDVAIAWWATVLPALAVAGTVLVIHLAGDALRDRLDPRSAGR